MNGVAILKRIVGEDGNCCWATPKICQQCPLSQLKTKDNGSFASCIEALGIEEMTEEQADRKYKEVAERLLLDEAIDSILGAPDGSE